jgi:hypothetical protein
MIPSNTFGIGAKNTQRFGRLTRWFEGATLCLMHFKATRESRPFQFNVLGTILQLMDEGISEE